MLAAKDGSERIPCCARNDSICYHTLGAAIMEGPGHDLNELARWDPRAGRRRRLPSKLSPIRPHLSHFVVCNDWKSMSSHASRSLLLALADHPVARDSRSSAARHGSLDLIDSCIR